MATGFIEWGYSAWVWRRGSTSGLGSPAGTSHRSVMGRAFDMEPFDNPVIAVTRQVPMRVIAFRWHSPIGSTGRVISGPFVNTASKNLKSREEL